MTSFSGAEGISQLAAPLLERVRRSVHQVESSRGLVQHVSVGADYEAIDVVDGKVPHGLHNAELSLVAAAIITHPTTAARVPGRR
jgi:hypothetical protein